MTLSEARVVWGREEEDGSAGADVKSARTNSCDSLA